MTERKWKQKIIQSNDNEIKVKKVKRKEVEDMARTIEEQKEGSQGKKVGRMKKSK